MAWSAALAAALSILRAPIGEVLPKLSDVLDELLPHDGLALLTGECALMSPLFTHGIDGVTADEMARLTGLVGVGRPWSGRVALGGIERQVLAVAAHPPESTGGLLAIALQTAPETAPDPETVAVVQQLVELAISHISDHVSIAEPVKGVTPPVTAVADLADSHAATLTALLGVLRSRRLDDGAARRTAMDIAVPALIETRTGELDAGEESAGEAFAMLAEKLSLLTRYNEIAMDLAAPEQRQRRLPGEVAGAARSLVRGAVLAMLQQGSVGRIRVAWQVMEAELRVTVRDDGPGTIASDALSVHRLHERLSMLGGTVTIESVPGWGTTITAAIPLATAEVAARIDVLNPREHDVLEQLSHGHRNRVIAERLSISENTVKFHVANILSKLGVSSRGEAAALTRRSATGISAGPPPGRPPAARPARR